MDDAELTREITPLDLAPFERRRRHVEASLTRQGRKASRAFIDMVADAVFNHGWFIYNDGPSHVDLRRLNASGNGGAELTIWRQAGNGQLVGSLLRRFEDVARPRTYAELTQVIEVEDGF